MHYTWASAADRHAALVADRGFLRWRHINPGVIPADPFKRQLLAARCRAPPPTREGRDRRPAPPGHACARVPLSAPARLPPDPPEDVPVVHRRPSPSVVVRRPAARRMATHGDAALRLWLGEGSPRGSPNDSPLGRAEGRGKRGETAAQGGRETFFQKYAVAATHGDAHRDRDGGAAPPGPAYTTGTTRRRAALSSWKDTVCVSFEMPSIETYVLGSETPTRNVCTAL